MILDLNIRCLDIRKEILQKWQKIYLELNSSVSISTKLCILSWHGNERFFASFKVKWLNG